jgi:hypothetical protein
MDPKLLTENGWKTMVQKFKVKDNGLQKALSVYEKLADDKVEERLKAIAAVTQLANVLKKAKEVAPLPDAVKYLTNLLAAAQTVPGEINKAKALAAKTEALNQKKAEAVAKQAEGDGDEEEEEGDSLQKLTSALKTLKLSQKPYYFLVCDAKPYGLVVSKKDIRKSAQARKELAQVAGGSTRPPKFGECRFDNGKYVFEMEKPPSGLARVLQKWIKDNTGLGIKVKVGTESAGDEETTPADQPAGASAQTSAAADKASAAQDAAEKAAAAKQAAQERNALEERRTAFKKARATWIAVKNKAEADLEKVKAGAKMHYLSDPDQYPKIVKGCKDIDTILDNLDDELRDTLDEYASAPLTNQAKLHTLSATAEKVLDRYYKYVAADSIMEAIDLKEFADVTVHAPIMKALGDLKKALA